MLRTLLANRIQKLRVGRNRRFNRRGACGEEDAWRWVGTSVCGDRHGPARAVGHASGRPHLSQRRSRTTANAGTLDCNRRDRDRGMVMLGADERGRVRCIRRLTLGQMPVGALPLMVCGVVVGPSVFCRWRSGMGALRVNVSERRRSADRHQRHDEQHMRDALEHHFYPDQGPTRCQLLSRNRVRMVGPGHQRLTSRCESCPTGSRECPWAPSDGLDLAGLDPRGDVRREGYYCAVRICRKPVMLTSVTWGVLGGWSAMSRKSASCSRVVGGWKTLAQHL